MNQLRELYLARARFNLRADQMLYKEMKELDESIINEKVTAGVHFQLVPNSTIKTYLKHIVASAQWLISITGTLPESIKEMGEETISELEKKTLAIDELTIKLFETIEFEDDLITSNLVDGELSRQEGTKLWAFEQLVSHAFWHRGQVCQIMYNHNKGRDLSAGLYVHLKR